MEMFYFGGAVMPHRILVTAKCYTFWAKFNTFRPDIFTYTQNPPVLFRSMYKTILNYILGLIIMKHTFSPGHVSNWHVSPWRVCGCLFIGERLPRRNINGWKCMRYAKAAILLIMLPR